MGSLSIRAFTLEYFVIPSIGNNNYLRMFLIDSYNAVWIAPTKNFF